MGIKSSPYVGRICPSRGRASSVQISSAEGKGSVGCSIPFFIWHKTLRESQMGANSYGLCIHEGAVKNGYLS